MQHFDPWYLTGIFLAMAAVSFFERALPFVASKWLNRQRWVKSLGAFLPMAIMVLLTVHAATDAAVARQALPLPEVCAIALTVIVQWVTKNPLLSIFSGTALYVVWVNGWLL